MPLSEYISFQPERTQIKLFDATASSVRLHASGGASVINCEMRENRSAAYGKSNIVVVTSTTCVYIDTFYFGRFGTLCADKTVS